MSDSVSSLGPRKLAKILVFALERRDRAVNQALGLPSMDALTLQSPITPSKTNGSLYGLHHGASSEGRGDSPTPLAPAPRSQTEAASYTEHGGSLAPPGFASPLSQGETPSQPTSSREDSADFLLVDDNAINLKVRAMDLPLPLSRADMSPV